MGLGGGPGTLTLFTLVLLSPLAASQLEDQAPPVEIEAATIEGYVTPVIERRNATFEVRVGCEDMEAPGTRTQVELEVLERPESAQIDLDRSSVTWRSEVGDCPADGTPFTANVSASVALAHDAPGFQEQTVPIQATVTKRGDPPMNEPRTYGPYNTTLTFTPGYYHQHTVDLQGIQEAGPDGVATFNVTLVSRSNAEARYALAVEEAPAWVEVTFEPESLVVGPGGQAPIQVTAEQVAPAQGNDQAILQFNSTGNTTHAAGGQGGHHAFGVILDLSGTDLESGRSGIPALGAGVIAVLLAGVAVLTGRWRG